MGDFNEIVFSFEKQEGHERLQRQIDCFRSTLLDCDLHDLGFKGKWYTWERGKFSNMNIRERIARGVANRMWWDLFPDYVVKHLLHSFFDHCPILVTTKGYGTNKYGKAGKSFKFNADWCLDKEYEIVVQNYWNSSTAAFPCKLNGLRLCLMNWNKDSSRKRNAHKVQLVKKLVELS